MDEKIILSEINNVYLKNNMVIRPINKWSKSIHLLMKHFHDNGLPVPKIIKVDEQFEYIEYINGNTVIHNYPCKWDNNIFYEIGIFVKKLHNVAKKFKFNDEMLWKPNYTRHLGNPKIYSHCDLNPINFIFENNKIIGLIDWENAGPIDPLIELANVCWWFAQLFDDDLYKPFIFPSVKERSEQIKLILDAYGLNKNERKIYFEKLLELIITETAYDSIYRNVKIDTIGNLWDLAWRSRSLYWIWCNKEIIKKGIGIKN